MLSRTRRRERITPEPITFEYCPDRPRAFPNRALLEVVVVKHEPTSTASLTASLGSETPRVAVRVLCHPVTRMFRRQSGSTSAHRCGSVAAGLIALARSL